MSMYEKPPIGIAPHWFLYRARMRDLTEAILRYLEWIQAHENTERSGPYYEAIAKSLKRWQRSKAGCRRPTMSKADFTGQSFPHLRIGQAVLAKFISLSADPLSSNRDTTPTYKGYIISVNHKHRHATVEVKLRGGKIRESFKTWEVEPI